MREAIKKAALTVFEDKGFYRAGIRDIAALASCSLPTLYYYFKNKEALFEAVVCDVYKDITNQIEEQIPEGTPLLDRFYFAVMQRQMMEESHRKVFRIALKMRLGVDGFEAARARLGEWEEQRREREVALIAASTGDPVFAGVVMRVVDDMLQRCILSGETLPPERIKQELSYLLTVEN